MKKALLTGLLIATVFTGCIKQPTPECKQAKIEYTVAFMQFLDESKKESGYNTLTESTIKMCGIARNVKSNCEQNSDIDDLLVLCDTMKNKKD